jgi:nicotinate-nucleotide adenylyltransferase
LKMVQAFCADSDHFTAEDCEINRGGISYTYDTLQYIIQKYKNVIEGKPAFIAGRETAAEFCKWYHAADVARMADIIIARRNDDNGEVGTALFGNKSAGTYSGGFNSGFNEEMFQYPYVLLNNPVMPVSSTEIRTRIAEGKSWRYLVPEPVFQYIIERKLYGYK